jgi:hypothetical protein
MSRQKTSCVFHETVQASPTNFDFMRQRLLRRAGLLESPKPRYTLESLRASEWSEEFEQLMRNRLIVGALRYGPISAPNKPQYDRLGSIEKRIKAYRESGNKELLVDCANLFLMEFVEYHHPKAHFHAQDNATHHVSKI